MARPPISPEVGFSQLENSCPVALPTGTRREAIPPTAAPRANGVTIEEIADAPSIARSPRGVWAPVRRAYAAPRTMIPIAARSSGTDSAEAIEPHGAGWADDISVRTES